MHRAVDGLVLRHRVHDQLTVVIAVITSHHDGRHVLLRLRSERHHVDELGALLRVRQVEYVVARIHLDIVHAVDLVSDIPQVLLLVEDLDLVHVVLAVYLCLDLEHRVRVPQVCLHLIRDLIIRSEQLRIDLFVCLSDRIGLIHDVESSAAVVCVHDDLDGVSDVVGRTDSVRVTVVRLGVRILAACCVSIQYPVELAVNDGHVRILFIREVRHDLLDSAHNISYEHDLRLARDV